MLLFTCLNHCTVNIYFWFCFLRKINTSSLHHICYQTFLCKMSQLSCELMSNGQKCVTVTFDLWPLISSSLSQSGNLCQIWRISLEVFLSYHVHKNRTDGRGWKTWKHTTSSNCYIYIKKAKIVSAMSIPLKIQKVVSTAQVLIKWHIVQIKPESKREVAAAQPPQKRDQSFHWKISICDID